MRRRRLLAILSAVVVVVVVVVVSLVVVTNRTDSHSGSVRPKGPARAGRLVTITIPDRAGEIPSTWLGYPGPPRADVLLPAHYDPHERYPLLILLNGLNTDYSFYAHWGLTEHFRGLDAIVVMPEGASGWFTDWWNNSTRGDPAWESYELNEVIPAILARYPILPQRRYHAIAGISMGGLGATYLGGRLPGFFGSVVTLSGFVDSQYLGAVTDAGMGQTSFAAQHGDSDPDPVEGPPDGFYLAGHNPTQLVTNLKQTRVFQSTGTGVPSRVTVTSPANLVHEDTIEESGVIYPMNKLYQSALTAVGIDVTYQVHPGIHDIPDFNDEIQAMLAWGLFKPVVTDPRSWVNDTVASSGQLWDISYRFTAPPDAVVRFRRSGDMLSIGSAGSDVTITTAHGCVVHSSTPSTIRVPAGTCR